MPSPNAHESWIRQLALGPDIPEREAILRVFGERLRSLRVPARLSQTELAARCFTSHDRISDLECADTEPRLTVVLMLAHALGVSAGELTDGLPAPTRQAGRAHILALVARQPGISTDELAQALGLPSWYVLRSVLFLQSFGEIVRDPTGWQPRSAHTPSGEKR
jgi:transcriptional regulator with XRE-family HTH domain